MKLAGYLVLLLATVAMTASAARADVAVSAALPEAGSFMRVYGTTTAPTGYQNLCKREGRLCAGDAKPNQRVVLNSTTWSELAEVNAIANATVEPKSDKDIYGVSEHWAMPGREGDCEDYALLKQSMLADRGWPLSALVITVVRDETGQGHAVLTARTLSGDFVLDNRRDEIVAWDESPYEFVKRQSAMDPSIWMALEPTVDTREPEQFASAKRAN